MTGSFNKIIFVLSFLILGYSCKAQLNAEPGKPDKIGTCLPSKITYSGISPYLLEIAYDSITKQPTAMVTTYGNGDSYIKKFSSKNGKIDIEHYKGSNSLKNTSYITMGSRVLWKSIYADDKGKEIGKRNIIEFGEIQPKRDTILLSSVYHDKLTGGDTIRTEELIRMNEKYQYLSREYYTNGELSSVIFYRGHDNRFNPVSYVANLGMEFQPANIYTSETVITYAEGEPQEKRIYNYNVEYNRDLLPTRIEKKLGSEMVENWVIEYECVE
jgi:hypothetical protein